jgi:hypothetical protein
MDTPTTRTRPRSITFRVVNSPHALRKGELQIDLVKSGTRVRWVKVDQKEITWTPPGENGGNGFTRSIQLDVARAIPNCPSFQVRVDFVGTAPVIGGIRSGKENAAKVDVEDPAKRTERREKVKGRLKNEKLEKYYQWFTMLDERSDEAVIAAKSENGGNREAAGPDGEFDLSAAITSLRGQLRTNLNARATGARWQDGALVCTPEFTSDVAVNVLLVHDLVFKSGAMKARGLAGGKLGAAALAREITDAFLAFCQGDLRVVDYISDLNVEPDSAMVFLFAEYALTLLQVVDQFGAPGAAELENPEAQEIAQRLFADRKALSIWKRVAASFVLGQRAYMRAYSPRRLHGPARYEDYVRTNFDPTEKLDIDEAKGLRARYAALKFSAASPLKDKALRTVFWRHALNAAEAFPGDLEEDRYDELGNLMLPDVGATSPSASVPLRALRGADLSIRRHVRHEIASVATTPRGVASTDKLRDLGVDEPRRAYLATMLAAYAGARGTEVDPKALEIGANSTVDSISLRLDDVFDGVFAIGKPA